MRSTNLFIVRGHVGADAKGFDGGKVAKVSVATNRIWFDRETRERKEAVDWVTLTILNEKIAKWALENIKKGDPCTPNVASRSAATRRTGKRFTRLTSSSASSSALRLRSKLMMNRRGGDRRLGSLPSLVRREFHPAEAWR